MELLLLLLLLLLAELPLIVARLEALGSAVDDDRGRAAGIGVAVDSAIVAATVTVEEDDGAVVAVDAAVAAAVASAVAAFSFCM